MRGFPELEALLPDEHFIHLDAKAGRIADIIDGAVELGLRGEDSGVVEAMVELARRRAATAAEK